jgi:predicted RNA polymerase sigma factor
VGAGKSHARCSREAAAAEELPLVVAPALFAEPGIDPDYSLVLLFMCCHPSLSSASVVALTLRAVGGLTTAEIAKSFLVPEATMAQRITRAKQHRGVASAVRHAVRGGTCAAPELGAARSLSHFQRRLHV